MPEYISKLHEYMKTGKFVFTGELEPEKTVDINHTIKGAQEMIGSVIACNVTDGPQAMAYHSSLTASYLVLKAGMEPVYQLTCRDRNRIGLIADLLGAYALGIRNVLTLTGDHAGVGDTPNAKPVFDIDSGQLCYLAKKLQAGEDLNGHKVETPPKFWLGMAGNPNCETLEAEIMKIQRKSHLGDFVQTQVIYQMDKTKDFLNGLENTKNADGDRLPVCIGVFPMKSYGIAKYFNDFIPGVSVPQELLDAFKAVKKSDASKGDKEKAYAKLNVDFFVPFIKELKQTTKCAGVHIMAVDYPEVVRAIIEEVLK
ncbi:MAG: 5,10-methylenetetrahydrofolate reductase [Candidatus Lokiarchaeota archaeon]|nr:5,10-methylenetetrahydrofolate reductase [Candidatus Lokiarchaeota archaeon]